jgi:hypothetical protein
VDTACGCSRRREQAAHGSHYSLFDLSLSLSLSLSFSLSHSLFLTLSYRFSLLLLLCLRGSAASFRFFAASQPSAAAIAYCSYARNSAREPAAVAMPRRLRPFFTLGHKGSSLPVDRSFLLQNKKTRRAAVRRMHGAPLLASCSGAQPKPLREERGDPSVTRGRASPSIDPAVLTRHGGQRAARLPGSPTAPSSAR